MYRGGVFLFGRATFLCAGLLAAAGLLSDGDAAKRPVIDRPVCYAQLSLREAALIVLLRRRSGMGQGLRAGCADTQSQSRNQGKKDVLHHASPSSHKSRRERLMTSDIVLTLEFD